MGTSKRPVALAEPCGLNPIERHQGGIEGEEIATGRNPSCAYVLRGLHIELVLLKEVQGERITVRFSVASNKLLRRLVVH